MTSTRTGRPVRTGIVGFGVSGRIFHAPFIKANENYSLDAIVTRNPARASEARRLHPGAVIVNGVDDLLSRNLDLDLLVIATPPATHVDIATAAIDAGLHVVVDKPFAPSAAEGRALVAHAQRWGRLLTVFQNRRWDDDFLTVNSLVASDALGTIHRFESRFEWWKPRPRTSWKTTASIREGGGILFDLGTHVIDQALRLFGEVSDVYAEVGAHRADAHADDDAFVALMHESGTISHLWMSSLTPQRGPRFRLLGARGGFTIHGLDQQEEALAGGATPTEPGFGRRPADAWGLLGVDGGTTPHPMEPGNYGAFYHRLSVALRDMARPPVEPADAVRVLEIIDEIHAAHPIKPTGAPTHTRGTR